MIEQNVVHGRCFLSTRILPGSVLCINISLFKQKSCNKVVFTVHTFQEQNLRTKTQKKRAIRYIGDSDNASKSPFFLEKSSSYFLGKCKWIYDCYLQIEKNDPNEFMHTRFNLQKSLCTLSMFTNTSAFFFSPINLFSHISHCLFYHLRCVF